VVLIRPRAVFARAPSHRACATSSRLTLVPLFNTSGLILTDSAKECTRTRSRCSTIALAPAGKEEGRSLASIQHTRRDRQLKVRFNHLNSFRKIPEPSKGKVLG